MFGAFSDGATLTFAIANPETVTTPLGYYKLNGYVYLVNPDGSVYVQQGPFGGGLTYTSGSPRANSVIAQIREGKGTAVSDTSVPAVPTGGTAPKSAGPGMNFWDTANSVVSTFAPLLQTGIQELAQGRRNTSAYLAGQIAKKQAQYAKTTDPVKRAQLAAEIQAMQQQIGAYNSALTTPIPDSAQVQQTGISSWVPWAVLGIGGVLALAAVTAATGRR